MFLLSAGSIIPIGLGEHTRFKGVGPKLFGHVGKPGFISFERGKTGKITTKVSENTRDKHDFYMTYKEQQEMPTELISIPLRKKWNETLNGIAPVAIRYRWNRAEERIDSAFMITPDGKSKIEIDDVGKPVRIYFKPNSKNQELIGSKPLIVKADINTAQVAVIVQKESGGFTTLIKMPIEHKVTELKDDFGFKGKWVEVNECPSDPRIKVASDVLLKQLFLFVGHYNDKKARFEIESRYKSNGNPRMN